MTAAAAITAIWTSFGIRAGTVGRDVFLLQREDLVPRGRKNVNLLPLWRPSHHLNLVIRMALPESGLYPRKVIDPWRQCITRMTTLLFTDSPYLADAVEYLINDAADGSKIRMTLKLSWGGKLRPDAWLTVNYEGQKKDILFVMEEASPMRAGSFRQSVCIPAEVFNAVADIWACTKKALPNASS